MHPVTKHQVFVGNNLAAYTINLKYPFGGSGYKATITEEKT